MDEMAIRKQADWKGDRSYGYYNYRTGLQANEALPMAKEALVFLVIALKIPIAYFLVNGLSASHKANLLLGCLKMLYDVGAEVVSLTFDGAASNLSMVKQLGCNLT